MQRERKERIQRSRQTERTERISVAVAVVGLAVFLAVSIALAVDFSLLRSLDTGSARYFGATAVDHPAWKTTWVVVGTIFSSGVIRVITLGVIILNVLRYKTGRNSIGGMLPTRDLLLLGVGVVVGGIVPVTIKAVVQRPRPPQAVVWATQSSFPSGHSFGVAVAVLVVLVIARGALRGGWLVAAIAAGAGLVVLVAFSRVALAVHYPSDVTAGVGLGLAWGGLSARICLFARLPALSRAVDRDRRR